VSSPRLSGIAEILLPPRRPESQDDSDAKKPRHRMRGITEA